VNDQSGNPSGVILVSALGRSREWFLSRCCKGSPLTGAGVLSQKQVGKQPGPVPTKWIDKGHSVGASNFPRCLTGPACRKFCHARQVGSDDRASHLGPIKTYDSSVHRGRRAANTVECNSDTSYSLLCTTGRAIVSMSSRAFTTPA
jgi:hypothetical protein